MASGADRINMDVAHPARRYNYWLGGKDNFAADRASADEIERAFPTARIAAQANRQTLGRMVTYLARDAKPAVRQFLDIGTGLPTVDNTHEVAQRIAPESRIVYVDNDPLVMSHARALLTSSPEGRTAYIEADLRQSRDILADSQLREVLDFGQPVAVMLIAVAHFIPGPGAAKPLLDTLMEPLVSGSYVALTHMTTDFMTPKDRQTYTAMLESGKSDVWPRSKDEIEELLAGLDLVEPGIVLGTNWMREPQSGDPAPGETNFWAAMARKP
ncbi:SAM-dependent methyltransferase [Actinoplanes sp. NPDC020271]|uniref:SAM-dependent methyltransferase n=1 Tax=Actinoplanes sp. NPDC020271 TaxID=3363896 RepID=UPI00379B3C3B